MVVDRRHPSLHTPADLVGSMRRCGECVGSKPIRQPVGFGNRVVKRVERIDDRNRPKRLVIPKVLVGDSFVILGRLCGVIPCCRRRFGDGISIEVAG